MHDDFGYCIGLFVIGLVLFAIVILVLSFKYDKDHPKETVVACRCCTCTRCNFNTHNFVVSKDQKGE